MDHVDDPRDEDAEWEDFPGTFESIRTPTGLETGCIVTWPGLPAPLQLSTTLPETSIAPMFDGTQWAGTRIWRACLVGLQYVLVEIHEERLKCTRLLELGSGLAVPGMILHALTQCQAILSDKEDLREQLESNIASNFPNDTGIQAKALDWSPQAIQALLDEQRTPFDLVLNCDCIYQPLYGDSWKALLDCQYTLLKADPTTAVITSVERRRADGIENYITSAEQLGLVVEKIKIPFKHPLEVEIYRLHLTKE